MSGYMQDFQIQTEFLEICKIVNRWLGKKICFPIPNLILTALRCLLRNCTI
uniref:Uncharacterized protein n=1 Tax=Arundo donax TaxID=35708 RepID=A0A0A9B9P1_ARUDO